MVCLISLAVIASCTSSNTQNVSVRPSAVLGVSSSDVAALEENLAQATSQEIEGVKFTLGTIAGRPVVTAWTGVGKVNTAVVTTLLIEHFEPTRVIHTGIAGGIDPNLEPGDIVIAKQTAHHDMGYIGAEGFEPGGVKNRFAEDTNPTFFPADPNVLAVAQQAGGRTRFDPISHRNGQRPPRVVTGTIVTGDVFVASKSKCEELAGRFEADAVDMEGAAVAQICYQQAVSHLIIRSIADKADESAVVDKQRFYTQAAENAAALVRNILEN
jgi:adenosylhomocysteine nucleosidase